MVNIHSYCAVGNAPCEDLLPTAGLDTGSYIICLSCAVWREVIYMRAVNRIAIVDHMINNSKIVI